MNGLLVVPAGMVGHVREGLFGVLGPVCASLGQVRAGSIAGRRCGWQREPLVRLGRVGALLDVIGRSAGEPPRRVMVDVAEHGWTLLEALHCEVQVLEGLLREARAYQSGGWACGRLRGQIRVLRGFARTVEEQVLAAGATPMEGRRWSKPGGPCVGDVEVVERRLLDLVPGGGLGSARARGWQPFSRARRRTDFAACCLHAPRG